jgi:hypothetical protein
MQRDEDIGSETVNSSGSNAELAEARSKLEAANDKSRVFAERVLRQDAEIERLQAINAAMSAQIAAVKHDQALELARLRTEVDAARGPNLEALEFRSERDKSRSQLAAANALLERHMAPTATNGIGDDSLFADTLAHLSGRPTPPVKR